MFNLTIDCCFAGVYKIAIDPQQHKVTVVGDVGVDLLIQKLEKNGKRAVVWSDEEGHQPTVKEKGKSTVQQNSVAGSNKSVNKPAGSKGKQDESNEKKNINKKSNTNEKQPTEDRQSSNKKKTATVKENGADCSVGGPEGGSGGGLEGGADEKHQQMKQHSKLPGVLVTSPAILAVNCNLVQPNGGFWSYGSGNSDVPSSQNPMPLCYVNSDGRASYGGGDGVFSDENVNACNIV